MYTLFSATEDVLAYTHIQYRCSEWECYVCTGVHVCMFASLCVCQQNGTFQYAEKGGVI